MVQRHIKFIRKLEGKQSKRVRTAIKNIKANQLSRLDVKPLAGQKGWYRCRVGQVRIIFIKTPGGQDIIHDIDFRGGAYRKR